MWKKPMHAVIVGVALMLASTSLAESVLVSSFEGDLGGWYKDAATLSFSATGATAGTQALQVDGPGGWKINAKLNVKAHRAILAKKGAKITADVTAFEADMTTPWMQVEMIVNAQNNNDNGANNNLGWNPLGGKDVIRDGQPHTYTWDIPEALTTKIAGADDSIAWFEFALVSNLDGASVVKFYIDNIQVAVPEPTTSVMVSNFEGGLDGWYDDTWTAGTIAVGTTGATAGAQAMQVQGPGGWQQLTKVNVKPYLEMLGTQGVKVTADVTAFAADMTSTWMQVGMVINCQNNNDSGANNNLGWNDLGLLDVAADGQPHTLTWVLSDAVTGKIAGADDTISWFEFLLISNVDAASVVKFYVDNVQITGPVVDTGKSSDFILGNWEHDMDGWAVAGGADVRFSDVNGVTLDNSSLDVYTKTGAWASVLTLNLLDPNNADALAAFRANTKISADITHLVIDWPVDDIPGWNGTHFVINCGGDGWSLWQDLGYRAGWSRNNGDRTDTATWDYSPYLSRIQFDKMTWCSLEVIVNANDPEYAGWVWFYIDNMRMFGGGVPLNPQPANGATDVNVETLLRWTGGAFASSHNLYLGTSSGAVAQAEGNSNPSVLFVPLDGTSFDPNVLEFNTHYYWRVDGVNDVNPDGPWVGDVWNFTTGNFVVVEDFESYQDVVDEGKAIFDTWFDGWGNEANNGAIVGNATAPFAQDATTAAHGGAQLMPLGYDNSKAPISEATRTWDEPQDWTVNGFNCLKLFVAGKSANTPGGLYVTVKDSAGKSGTVELDITAASVVETWTELEFPLSQLSGVNVASVSSLIIGVKNKAGAPAAQGTLLVDDIRLAFKALGLVAHYKLEGNVLDNSGNGHDGALAGDPNFPVKYVSGPAGFGQGMLFDGTGGHQSVELGTFNPSAATGHLTVALWAKWDGPSNQWQGLIGKRDSWSLTDMMWHLEVNRDSGTIGFARYDSYPNSGGAKLPIGTWAHVAVTFNGTTARFYVNGVETGNGGFSFGLDKDAMIEFGSDNPNGGNAFNGALDDVRLYDKALSAAEVQALMTAK